MTTKYKLTVMLDEARELLTRVYKGEEVNKQIQEFFELNSLPMMPQHINIEGNNGGDYLRINQIENNLIRLDVGHCCVVYFNDVLPVEVITHILADALECKTSITLIRTLKWNTQFQNELEKQVLDYKDKTND